MTTANTANIARTTSTRRAARILAGVTAFVAASAISLGTPANAQPAAGAGGGGGAAGLAGQGMNIDLATVLKAKPGAWADYTMSGKGEAKPVTIRYALIERSASKFALEIDSATPKGEMVIHFDFVAQGTDGSAWKVVSGKMQLGEQKMDLPAAQLASSPPLKTSDSPGQLVGSEDLTTPVGPFACKHYKKAMLEGGKGPSLDVWINDKVSPTGLVKSTLDAMGVQMTLLATGSGAQSKLH
jgi:hypothetical protein